jgi:hypothetical protein
VKILTSFDRIITQMTRFLKFSTFLSAVYFLRDIASNTKQIVSKISSGCPYKSNYFGVC